MSGGPTTRLVALVRTDVVGSTPLTLRLGDDRASPLFQRHLRTLQRVVDGNDGTLVKSLGDGLIAAFESATSALRASREMQASTHRHNRLHGERSELHIRVGVSVGDVTWVGADLDGRPAIEAERLQASAEPDQILCSRTLVELTGGRFDGQLESLGLRSLKGYPNEIEVFDVAWQPTDGRARELDPALRSRTRVPFVAREEVLADLVERWRRAERGEASAVVVAGEAGIGKSRLIREVARQAHADGATVLFGGCAPDRDRPYEPFTTALDHFVSQLRGQTYRLGSRAGDLAPLLGGLVGELPPLAGAVPPNDTADLGGTAERAALRQAVWAWLAEIATDDAVLFLIEDVHWADAPTLGLLGHIVATMREERLLLLLTMRTPLGDDADADLERLSRRWHRSPLVTEIELPGLSAPGAVALLEAFAGRPLDVTPEKEFARQVWEHTGGNPLFIEAVLDDLIARGLLHYDDGRWTPPVALAHMAVPKAVQDVVLGRLATVSSTDRSVLQVAALLGPEIDPDLLADVAGDLGIQAGPAIDRAHESGLLVEGGSAGSWRFSHEIVRDAVAGAVPATQRTALHRQIARTMTRRYPAPSEAQAEELCHQLSFGPTDEEKAQAAAHASDAAGKATARGAAERAATLHARAAELYAAAGHDVAQCDALLEAGRAAKKAGSPEARATLVSAIALADRLGDGERLARAALSCSRGMFSSLGSVDAELVEALERALILLDDRDSPLRASVLAVLGAELTYSEDHDRQLDASQQAVAMARRLDDRICLASVLNVYAGTLWRPDTLVERMQLARELEGITAGLGRPQWRFSAASFGFQAAMEAGAFALAEERLGQMEAAARSLGQQGVTSYLTLRQGVLAAARGDLVGAERLANEAVEHGRAVGYRDSEVFYYGQMWMICYHAGRLGELRPVWELAVESRPDHTVLRAALAALYAEVGETERCRALADTIGTGEFDQMDQDFLVTAAVAAMAAGHLGDARLARVLEAVLEPYDGQLIDNGSVHFGAVGHFLAMVLGIDGRSREAADRFEDAAATHRRLREWPMLARTLLEHGRLLRRSGDPAAVDAATALLASAREVAVDHGCAGTVAAVDGETARLATSG